jgi:hypothetical protein
MVTKERKTIGESLGFCGERKIGLTGLFEIQSLISDVGPSSLLRQLLAQA